MSISSRIRMRLLAICCVLVGLVALPAATSAADSFGMRAYGGEGEGEGESQELAVFKTAKCQIGKGTNGRKRSFFATGTSTNGQYRFSVSIYFVFTGFHKYNLVLDRDADIVLSFYPTGHPTADFANDNVPPFPAPGSGEVRFSPNGKRMRAGFVPVLWNRDASAQIVLVGGVECRYPQR